MVLIGINFYPRYTEKPLKGCIQDVKDASDYLRRYECAHVRTFTADWPAEENYETLSPSEEDPGSWPTFENITTELQAIIARAKPGDLVYIHYAGHGTRKTFGSSDIALVLFDKRHGTRYFHGDQLARYLKGMIEKGLQVTLVLDCCYSGDFVRDDDPNRYPTRGVDWDQAIDDKFPVADSEILDIMNVDESDSRDTDWCYNWLNTIDESKYLLIAACGPHEKAYEGKLEGLWRGMLSFYFVDSLTQLQKSHEHDHSTESFIDHLTIQLDKHKKQQTPMHRGDGKFSLLKRISSLSRGYVYVRKSDEGDVCLNTGRIHGVCKDDIYATHPFDFTGHGSSNTKSVPQRLKVTEVRASTCDAKIIYGNNIVDVGWKASLLKSSSQPIRLKLGMGIQKDDFVAVIKSSRYPRLLEKDYQLPCYSIVVNKSQEYEILGTQDDQDNQQRVNNIPKISSANDNAIHQVITILEQIAKFEHIRNLPNAVPIPDFKDSFNIKFEDAQGNLLQDRPRDPEKILHMHDLKVTVQNGEQSLYIAMYSMGSSWQINPSDCNVLEPMHRGKNRDGIYSRNIRQKVPDGQEYCDDIIKVLITTSPISVAQIRLPKLREQQGKSERGGDSPLLSNSSGMRIDSQQLNMLYGDRDSDFSSTMQTSRMPSSEEHWFVHTFHVRTVKS